MHLTFKFSTLTPGCTGHGPLAFFGWCTQVRSWNGLLVLQGSWVMNESRYWGVTRIGIMATTWRNQENQWTIWIYLMIPVMHGSTRRNFGLKPIHLSLLIEPWWLRGQPKNQRWISGLWLVSGTASSLWGPTLGTIRSNLCSMTTSKRMCDVLAFFMSLRCWRQSCFAVVLSLPSPSHQWTLCGNRSNYSTRRRRGNRMLVKSLGIAGTSESSWRW